MAFVLRICRMLMEMARCGSSAMVAILLPVAVAGTPLRRDDEKGLLSFKIRGRIVVCEMSILPDPHKSNVNGSREQRLAAALDDLPRDPPSPLSR